MNVHVASLPFLSHLSELGSSAQSQASAHRGRNLSSRRLQSSILAPFLLMNALSTHAKTLGAAVVAGVCVVATTSSNIAKASEDIEKEEKGSKLVRRLSEAGARLTEPFHPSLNEHGDDNVSTQRLEPPD